MADFNNSALVLFSGGQDSATCLAWALHKYSRVETIGFNYGQRHSIELECRNQFISKIKQSFPDWARKLGDDHMMDLRLLGQISDTALTKEKAIQRESSGLPNTFVPGRNLLFLTFAATVAYRRNLKVIIGGMCETDYSGYPDCRDDTIKALQVAISLGLDTRIVLETPLMWIDKAATWTIAQKLGGQVLLDLIQEDTHTCYMGDRSKRHEWGYGCGSCPACDLRRVGFENFVKGQRS
jgi:7-cyano-7-deazaguanine synthase